MEEVTSSQSSVAFETEINLEILESSSPASCSDDKDHISEDILRTLKPTSKEFKKTWGFRKTTIAKREVVSDADMEAAESAQQPVPSLRRSGRQPKRTERVEEFLTTVRRNRGRKSNNVEDSSDRSCPVTDAETASEGSVESIPDIKSESNVNCVSSKVEVKKEEDDSSDSDGMTLKELQDRLRSRRSDIPTSEMVQMQTTSTTNAEHPNMLEGAVRTRSANRAALLQQHVQSTPVKQEACSAEHTEHQKPEEIKVSPKIRPEAEKYDPNALYCICRQPHNNRFMICCDRCEEWFHGDCVGISEVRGRLLEKDGEDYICPNCTILQGHGESGTDSDQRQQPVGELASSNSEVTSIFSLEQCAHDQGIKGRIEKAAHPTGKKKLKIFHPVEVPETTKGSHEISETTEVSHEESVCPNSSQSLDVAGCIGPGCSNLALPDSVYCGHDCILKHAAAAMKSLNAGKETKPKEKVKVKPEKRSPPKPQAPAKPPVVHKAAVAEKPETVMKTVLVMIPRMEAEVSSKAKVESSSGAPSWESDHNYIAVKPEKTPAISSTLFYKSEKIEEPEKKPEAPSPPVKKSAPSPMSLAMKPISALPRIPMLKRTLPPSTTTKQPSKPYAGSNKNILPIKPHHHPSTSPISKLPPIPKKTPLSTSSGSGMKKATPSNSLHRTPNTASPSHSASTSVANASPKPVSNASQPGPNIQIRQNIRRSLKEILFKRVNDSDDLVMAENEVARIAVNIEKEMFSLFKDTDNRYKSKYRNLMFNLKDPKNQGLFHRVLREEISLAKLVRLKPEDLVSKKISSWRETVSKSSTVLKSKSLMENKTPSRPTVVDMEESPPYSDTDTEQQEVARIPPPEKSSSVLPDIFSSMLNDTTSQHRAHLFDLNCKICTGQMTADDEPPTKRQKTMPPPVKKVETKTKPEIVDQPPPPPEDECETPKTISESNETVLEVTPEKTQLPSASPTQPETLLSSQGPTLPPSNPVTTVTVSGRDPRRAVNRPLASSTASDSSPRTAQDNEEVPAPPQPPPVFTAPKSILMKPTTDIRYLTSSPSVNMPDIRAPQDGDTSLFLSRLNPIWKGFINMQNVAKFVTKAYPVSGSVEYLNEDLPDTIHIGGRISPKTVWDYVGKLKSSLSKELSLIRFHPATEEEEVAYISLYSYFSSRGRFGVVANNNRHVKDLYLIPLSAKDPIPSKLLPFEGPGLESTRPNMILGLVICQRNKRPAPSELEKNEEKRLKAPSQEEMDILNFTKPPLTTHAEKKPQKHPLYPSEPIKSTTPPGSPQPIVEPVFKVTPSVLTFPSVISSTSMPTSSSPPPAERLGSAAKSATPLDHILKTLFGKTSDSKNENASSAAVTSNTTVETVVERGFVDPIVQQFGQMSKDKALEEEDDRPYDPEEEYDPEKVFDTSVVVDNNETPYEPEQPCESLDDEEAYDPEDETILEEAKVPVEDLPNKISAASKMKPAEAATELVPSFPGSPSLQEQQKMLDELNKQIEEQKRQLEEQEEALRQQRAAVGVSMAHFSVSDALMSPPPKSSLTKSDLFQREPSTTNAITSANVEQFLTLNRDPRQARDPRHAAAKIVQLDVEDVPMQLQSEKQTFSDETIETIPEVKKFDSIQDEIKPVVSMEMSKLIDQKESTLEKQEDIWHNSKDAVASESISKPSRKVLLPTPVSNAPLLQTAVPTGSEKNYFPSHEPAWASETQNFDCQKTKANLSGQIVTPLDNRSDHFEPEKEVMFGLNKEQFNSQTAPFIEHTVPVISHEDNRHAPHFPISSILGPPQLEISPNFGEQRPLSMPNPGLRTSPIYPEENCPTNLDAYSGLQSETVEQKGPGSLPAQLGMPPHLFGDRGLLHSSFTQKGQSPPSFDRQNSPHVEFQDPPFGILSDGQLRFDGPRGPIPASFMVRGQPFSFDGPHRPPLSQFKPPIGTPIQPPFGGPRGPTHFSGPRGPYPNEFDVLRGSVSSHYSGPRGPSPPQLEDLKNSSPLFPNQRGPVPIMYGGQRGPLPSRFSEDSQQIPRSQPRPLLDLPTIPPTPRSEGWNKPPDSLKNFGDHRPDPEQHWEPSNVRQNKDHRGQGFQGRSRNYEGRNEPEASEHMPNQGFEDRRREREHDAQWDRERGRNWNRERNRDHERPRTREPNRDWEKNRDGDKDMEKRELDRNRDRDRERNRDRDRGRERDRERDRERERDRDRERTRDRDRDSYKRRERSRSRDRDRDRSRSRERERDRDKGRERERDRDRTRDRERDRERGKDCTVRSKSTESNKDSKSGRSKDTSESTSTEPANLSHT